MVMVAVYAFEYVAAFAFFAGGSSDT